VVLCRAHDPTLKDITVHAAPSAVRMYDRLGFRALGPEREQNGIRFVPMALALEPEVPAAPGGDT